MPEASNEKSDRAFCTRGMQHPPRTAGLGLCPTSALSDRLQRHGPFSFAAALRSCTLNLRLQAELTDEQKEAFEQLTEAQIEEFRQSFNNLDADGDGAITSTELKGMLESMGQGGKTDEEIQVPSTARWDLH